MNPPDNSTSWPLNLSPIYLSMLEDKLRLLVTSAGDFCMPYLSILHTKSKQLQGVREVCNAAVNFFTQMEEYIEHLWELLQLNQPGHRKQKEYHS